MAERKSHNELEMARQYSETSARVSDAIERKKKGKEAPEDLRKELDMWEHKVTVQELASKLGTDAERGLSQAKAKEILERDGPNLLSPPKVTPWYVKLLMQFLNFFAILLEVAGILCFIGYGLDDSSKDNLYLGIVLIAVVIITALFTFFQEFKSEKTMEKFKNFLPPTCMCRREGKTSSMDASQLVVGDVIDVKLGDKIPADIRIIANQKLKVDNSSLTGESEPIGRTVECTDENPLETKNLAFFGTLAIDGTATGIVVNTGDRTVFGRIAGLAAGSDQTETTLQRETHHFIVLISALAIFLGVVFFIFGFVKGTPVVNNVVFAIGIIVANVPEGLLATVTVSLTLTATRMSKKNVLVKKLECVETLGSTTTICSDKTGTLTQNRMTIVHVGYDSQVFDAPTATQAATYDAQASSYKALFYIGAVCGKAMFDADEMEQNPNLSIDERTVNGDASEAGILKFCSKQQDVAQFRLKNKQVATIPFNSANKFMLTVNVDSEAGGKQLRLCMKGAPERVLDRCDKVMVNGTIRPKTDQDVAAINANLQKLMAGGERVLGFAQIELPPEQYPLDYEFDTDEPNFPMNGLVFVGIMALLDPPRESVPDAVDTCVSAGIDVFMVTGDHPATAKSIAKQVGIIRDDTVEEVAASRGIPVSEVDPSSVKAIVVPGSQIRDLEEEDWNRILAHEQIVFARTSPQQKLLIVENCQRLGKIVAVTGDGVNDSPALKKANIGVAMGISGSDVSKEAADMVLLDDNFSSIVNGVEEGRLIFDNLKKSIAYTLSSNIPEIAPFVLFITIGLPMFLTTVLILLIDLGTDMLPAISLAYEKAESDIMRRKPRDAAVDRLVNRRLMSFSYMQIGMFQALAGIFVAMVVMNDYGLRPQTMWQINRNSHFASSTRSANRWLVSHKTNVQRSAHEAEFFTAGQDEFNDVFELSREDLSGRRNVRNRNIKPNDLYRNQPGVGRFEFSIPQSSPIDNFSTNSNFSNMVKIVGVRKQQPPCRPYKCTNGNQVLQNDFRCFSLPATSTIQVKMFDGFNPNVRPGLVSEKGPNHGCFDLWTDDEQRAVLGRAQSAYLISIIQVQWADGIICKSRILSLFQHGMSNMVFNIGLFEETALGALFIYTPFLRTAFKTEPIRFVHWLPALPFSLLIFTYDEVRKFTMRSGDRNGNKLGVWVKTYTYW